MTSLRYAIVGCGMMGHEHIRNLQLIEGCETVALFDTDPAMVASAQRSAPAAHLAASLDDLLDMDGLDAIVLATPNFRHAEHLRQIAARRTIPLLVEKPVVTDPNDRELIDALERDYAAPIQVAMEYRYMPPLQRFLAEVESATGGIRHLSIREHRFPFLKKVGNWNRFNERSGGTLVEKCCHFFDLMRLMTGTEARRVMASGRQAVNHLDEIYDGRTPDIWDAAFAIVDFDDQTRAMLDLCMFAEGSDYQEEIVAVGPSGRIDCLVPFAPNHWPDDSSMRPQPRIVIRSRDRRRREDILVPVDARLDAAGSHHGSTYFQHLEFREVVLGKRPPEVSLRDGWRAAAIGMAAQESAATGMAVEPLL
ncbi:MAG: Gfo/Idh/MocA family oxidoreductase [Ectothiorhodospiraceae bacterium AqS1]|nr:Gfo/Idh/MocA family oxidoreductase [Ectothiorhodospiraceae bacterium AqS1]